MVEYTKWILALPLFLGLLLMVGLPMFLTFKSYMDVEGVPTEEIYRYYCAKDGGSVGTKVVGSGGLFGGVRTVNICKYPTGDKVIIADDAVKYYAEKHK